ncbi:MAG: hypothetical protein LBO81_01100, partial [Clostridiales Family XIII bacterium]|nr:hypothetical protein [Clostridiales Family XIII bacterium]
MDLRHLLRLNTLLNFEIFQKSRKPPPQNAMQAISKRRAERIQDKITDILWRIARHRTVRAANPSSALATLSSHRTHRRLCARPSVRSWLPTGFFDISPKPVSFVFPCTKRSIGISGETSNCSADMFLIDSDTAPSPSAVSACHSVVDTGIP